MLRLSFALHIGHFTNQPVIKHSPSIILSSDMSFASPATFIVSFLFCQALPFSVQSSARNIISITTSATSFCLSLVPSAHSLTGPVHYMCLLFFVSCLVRNVFLLYFDFLLHQRVTPTSTISMSLVFPFPSWEPLSRL